MSNIIEFRKVIQQADIVNGVAVLDGETAISPILQLPPNGQNKMQVCAITISDRIPNVYNAGGLYDFNNTLVKLTVQSVGSFTAVIELPRGLYMNATSIQDAINEAIATLNGNPEVPPPLGNNPFWIDPADPGIIIETNAVTDEVIVTLDASKMSVVLGESFTMDISKATGGTDLGATLGFSQATAVMISFNRALGARRFVSDLEVKLDTQGTTVDVQCSLVSLRRRNEDLVRTLALVPFAGKNTASDNVWPSSGLISPLMVYEGNKSISFIRIAIRTLEGRPMLFMSGSIHVVISFVY